MEEFVRKELLTKTRQALDADDWDAVERVWQPLVEQGDPEAQYQLAYHWLRCTQCDDETTRDHMMELLRAAAARDHPDAIYLLACYSDPENHEYEKELLRAGRLGSAHAQCALGVCYATGEWSGPKDLAESAHWYRLAAEQGERVAQYEIGFMLLIGEGLPKNTQEGLRWLERAGGQGQDSALRLLADCYENGHCDVPVDAAKAQFWRSRFEENKRLNPLGPQRVYSMDGVASESSLQCLMGIEGVTGFAFRSGDNSFSAFYDLALITPAELDEKVGAVLSASPLE